MKLFSKFLTAMGALCIALPAMPAQAAAVYSAMYEFGDSLSDAGNDFVATGGALPAAPYALGEFTNGPNWVQYLSSGLGFSSAQPSLLGGNDYAFGGATTGYTGSQSLSNQVPSLTDQVNTFLSQRSGATAPSTALYSVWVGSNDLINILGNGVANQSTAVEGAAQTEATDIAMLAGAGARNFLVPLLGDLGKTPTLSNSGPAASAAGTALALTYNADLANDLASLASTPGVHLSFVDIFSLLDNAIANPGAFGYANVTDPCYVGPYTGGGTVCSNPNQYLFWDLLHPSSTAQAVIAGAAEQALAATTPEPATLLLLGIGLAGLGLARNRSWRG